MAGSDTLSDDGSDVAATANSATDVGSTIVETVAERQGVDPLALDPLYDAIDPEALEALVASATTGETDTTLSLSFTYEDLSVTVTAADGDVRITVEA